MEDTHATTPELMAKKPRAASHRFAGDDLVHWAWTEPSVWKPTMLATLEHHLVRGGKWHSLIDKVYYPANLESAYREVAANRGAPGVDHVTIEDFTARLAKNLSKLEHQLRDGSYHPQSIKRVHIPKPGTNETRPLGIPTVRDRVVQAALRHVLEPLLERQFAEHSYGFRPDRGCKDALRRVDRLIKDGYKYTVDVDLKSYFETIPHDLLVQELRKYVADNQLIGLVEKFLQADVFDGLKHWTPTAGAPQGAIIAPPTKVQNFLFPAFASFLRKKGEVDAVDDPKLLLFDLDAVDQRAQNLATKRPVSRLQVRADRRCKVIQTCHRFSQRGLFA